MRIFMSTGEASGDMIAAALAGAIREQHPDATFVGIGGERMRAAGFELSAETQGWASIGQFDALAKIPHLGTVAVRHAWWLRAQPVDLVVLVDFGAFNLRLARLLRTLGYRRPILAFFPPGAWLDNPGVARLVARTAHPLTAFEHQRAFYASLGLEIGYVGHPLVSLVSPRDPRSGAAPDGGTVALLPGSRQREVRMHLPRLLSACARLRATRPNLETVISVADQSVTDLVEQLLGASGAPPVRLVRGARAALDAADVALVASGTAVLEAALREVPTVALYVISPAQAKIARRVYHRRFVTLPNLLLDRALIPELLQEAATPENLADAAASLLRDASLQLAGMRDVRARLGPPDALARCARFALDLVAA